MTFNAPRPQNGPIAWAAFCLFGLVVAVYLLFDYRVGTESWWVGILLAVTVVVGFSAIEGWWLVSQRQVTVDEKTLTIRRWSDVFLAGPGRKLAVEEIRSLRFVYDNGKRVRIDTMDGGAVTFWAALWPRTEVDALLREAQSRGFAVNAEW